MKKIKWLGAASLLAASAAAHAQPIPGLFNTGVNSNTGVGIAGTVDDNYRFAVVGGTGTAVGTDCTTGVGKCGVSSAPVAGGFPFGNNGWLANSASTASTWLTPTASIDESYDPPSISGTYTWTLSFDLTGYDPSHASFSGRWLSDNFSTVTLNSTQLAATSANLGDSFSSWTSFAATGSSFVNGLNTLVFSVTNVAVPGVNPTGIRVEFTASSLNDVAAVPEPTGVLLALAGMGMVAGLARRGRVQTVVRPIPPAAWEALNNQPLARGFSAKEADRRRSWRFRADSPRKSRFSKPFRAIAWHQDARVP